MGKMEPEHREAIRASKIVRRYLEAVAANGRRQSPDRIRARISKLQQKKVDTDNVLTQLKSTQAIRELEGQLAAAEDSSGFDELEGEFIEVAAAYTDREGISRAVWREFGVPAAVLDKAKTK